MKLRILASLALLSATTQLHAQYATPADYRHEFGLNGGIAPILRPWGAEYRGNEVSNTPIFASATYHYNISENWQAGLSLGMSTRWETTGDQKLNDLNSAPFPTQKTTYLFADKSWEATARFNRVVPMYDRFKFNYGNFYYGVAAGAMFTVNTGERYYKQVDQKQGPQYTYLSQYNFQNATGWVAGVQVGYDFYFSPRFGVKAEFAPRFTRVKSLSPELVDANSVYQTFYFPAMIGVKYRIL